MKHATLAPVDAVQQPAALKDPTSRAAHVFAIRRYASLIGNWHVRFALGLLLAIALPALTVPSTSARAFPVAVFALAWFVAVLITDKYTHKYPNRYYTYLVAAHGKAALVMALVLAVALWLIEPMRAVVLSVGQSFALFVALDLLFSWPRRRLPAAPKYDHSALSSREIGAQAEAAVATAEASRSATAKEGRLHAFGHLSDRLPKDVAAQIRDALPGANESSAAIIDDRGFYRRPSAHDSIADLVISSVRINDVRRINRFFVACGQRLAMGGHFVCHYTPLDRTRARLQKAYGPFFWPAYLLHFAWYRALPKIPGLNKLYFLLTAGRNRELSKAEVWGRLSFCGLRVVSEQPTASGQLVIAKRVALPITNKRPSYYPVVGLTKVGLDGQLLRTHKVRSMYPFSEFLQKQIFEAHGLGATGKFKNDFRLTEYGKYIRRLWIDELPQLYDWLRGDIKLVGIRATSPHFLSLYPQSFIDLYVRVKPGLIPPLFDEQTQGFDHIVDVELKYLESYVRAPFRTDVAYLWATLTDILMRGVRSK